MLKQTLRFDEEHHDDIIYPSAIGFVFVHVASLGALWSGVTAGAVALCVGLYWARMFAVTAGFHRYFSHRSFRTSRVFQFVLAFLAQTSLQQGVLWWSAKHRHHHKHSDTPEDVHSPGLHGFLFAHVGWIFARERGRADYSLVKDLSQYPELVWLDRYNKVPGVLLAVVCFLIAGWPGLFVGFFLSTTVLFHGVFSINSLAHTFGRQRYLTGDDSRNSWWLALATMGEGWHNNHHYYQASTRQGWRWWEIDPTYYLLKLLSWTGLVWDLKGPPQDVLEGERRLSRRAIDKVAHQLAGSFSAERIADQIRARWAQVPSLEDLQPHLPHLPSLDELKRRAESMALRTPSLDEIAERAQEILIEAVSVCLLEQPLPARA
ncbi:MAG TPA: acyl-CoA desaturase [Gemmatimonadota bacterium]|nr:acyl-CoA desaturase [Gemmatimonadota bacterium]